MSTHDLLLRYWDSYVFIAYLKEEYDRAEQCSSILARASEGKTTIITSAMTLSEILWLEPQTVKLEESKQKIRDLFEYSCIKTIDYTSRACP